ncbi:macro domain-containing protein [Mycetohabitans sp. B5]|nr:macro domain-containing protein [Mycetohabitans sp. B5]
MNGGGRVEVFVCRALGGCRTGDARITGAHRLPARYVIHAVGPVWHDGEHGEPDLLAGCYRRVLELAHEHVIFACFDAAMLRLYESELAR